MKTLYLNEKPKRLFYINLTFSLFFFSIAVFIFVVAHQEHTAPEIPFYFFLIGSILISIQPIISFNTIMLIDVNDEICIFTSMHNSVTVKINDILSTEPLNFRQLSLTLLHHKNGTLILRCDYFLNLPDNWLEPFYSHISKTNSSFHRQKYRLY